MWTGTASMDQLRQRGRWNVEFFCNEVFTRPQSVFNWVPLRSLVVERKETLDPQSYSDHLFNYMSLENVQSATGDLVNFTPHYGREIRSRSKVFRKGDLLYGRLRPYLNKAFLANGRVSSGICSGEFYVLIPNTDLVLPHFLRFLLSSHYVQRFVSNLQTGSALPRLQLEDLMQIELPLPSLAKQSIYEEFLIQETARRRRLAVELAWIQQASPDALINALEFGSDPLIPHFEVEEECEIDVHMLPN
jgi:hypothetical protein